MTNKYLLQAFNLYHSIPLKTVRKVITARITDSSPSELKIEYGDRRYGFIYRFGAIVFFNMDQNEIDHELDLIRTELGPCLEDQTTETFNVHESDQDRFDFNHAELQTITIQSISMIAITVGQSAALETYEINADRMLRDSGGLMQKVANIGSVSLRAKSLLHFIGRAASTRQDIIVNLAILDPPEETWRSHELQKIFRETQQCFDIDVRFRALDRKLALVQDNIEILTDLATNRRSAILELLIIGLIALELILALLKR